ncbi:UDP-N-acetylmuramoyl-tripeptide--D-alanyl-D-alanine ligase [Rhodospirillum sp. A1_3_36]|uniref:UDP-N-acetylmuramoyl-tripeptide--D-alanyl-D- alanine ligase n=1 Tax=Rhodospirillum sp. A1_3_36 TaxID=3391666 RepID=UPI0039A620A6
MTQTTTPILWTAVSAAAALGVPARGSWSATGVSIDSRDVVQGDLFIALVGPRFDAHDYVTQALNQGAVAAIVSKPVEGADPNCLISVADTNEALWTLGRAARARFDGKVVGITGSVGKTGTKEMVTLALGVFGRVHATLGNLNNHFGVPLTLARLPVEADYAVIEMGMSAPGEITSLSQLARPHVALITTIAPAHLEFFTGVEQIADAKAEILEGLEPGGVAVFNRDNRFYEHLCRVARNKGINRLLGFGQHIAAEARLLDCAVDGEGTAVFALVGDRAFAFRMPVEGRHWAQNALGALAVVDALGLDPEQAARGLLSLSAPEGRGLRHRVSLACGEIQVIDESYNASPVSMVAALETLAQARTGPRGRRIAVVGDMLELGPDGPALHAALAKTVLDRGIDLVHTPGPLASHLWEALPVAKRGANADSADVLVPLLLADLQPGDVVMVKGSKGSKVSRVVEALLALSTQTHGGPRATMDS